MPTFRFSQVVLLVVGVGLFAWALGSYQANVRNATQGVEMLGKRFERIQPGQNDSDWNRLIAFRYQAESVIRRTGGLYYGWNTLAPVGLLGVSLMVSGVVVGFIGSKRNAI